MTVVLTVSTSCTSTEPVVEETTSYHETLLSLLPSVPEVPTFPELHWNYTDGMYWIDEHDVDILLDYGENILPTFKWELQQYQRKLDAVISAF